MIAGQAGNLVEFIRVETTTLTVVSWPAALILSMSKEIRGAPFFDGFAFRYIAVEAIAVHFHRVHADVDQQFGTILELEAHGMKGEWITETVQSAAPPPCPWRAGCQCPGPVHRRQIHRRELHSGISLSFHRSSNLSDSAFLGSVQLLRSSGGSGGSLTSTSSNPTR